MIDANTDIGIGLGVVFIVLFAIVAIVAGLVIYFLPSIIAYKRKHENKGIILLINFFAGMDIFKMGRLLSVGFYRY